MVAISPTAFLIPGYQVLEVINSGGFGVVHRALDSASGEEVAIKVGHLSQVPENSATRVWLRQVFDSEWNSLNRVRSERIVRPISRGVTDDNNPYLVLEYVPGVALSHYLASVEIGVLTFDLKQTMLLMLGAAEAVGALHENGLIHNDIQLSNFIVVEDGRVKLCDLAMATTVAEAKRIGSRNHRGTPGFYSAQTVETKRKDVFGLGSAFYHLLTGRIPFPPKQSDPFSLLAAQAPPPPPREVRPEREIPRPVDRIVMKAIHRAPTSRYADANEMEEDLRAIAIPPKRLKRPARRR
jgi:serine/threonine protein kinase